MFKRSVLSSSIAIAIAFSYQPLCAQESGTSKQNEPIEEIVVSGIRGSLTKALDIKREKIQITDSIVAEDIGKFPDNNVVEALQRVTGVQVTARGAGEVNTVTIRGLTDVSTTVNGREIFTSTGRSVALADIPASLINRVDVYKTRSASQVEGGIAGQIDVTTNRPFDFDDSKFVFAGRGIYQSNSEEIDPNVSMLLSDRWETGAGDFGALINVSYAETNYRDQNIWIGSLDPYRTDDFTRIDSNNNAVYTPGTIEGLPSAPGSTLNVGGVDTEYYLLRDAMGFTDFTGNRERPAANISLQWAPNESSEYLFEGFYNGYRNQSFNSLAFINTNGTSHFRNPELYDGTNVIKKNYVNNASMFTSGDGSTGETDSFVYALGGKWDLTDKLSLESEIVYQTSEYEYSFLAMRTNSVRDRLVIDFNEDDGLPLVAFLDDENTPNVDESSLANPEEWSMGTVYDNGGKDRGEATTWTFDGDYETDWSFIERLSFGVRYDLRGAEANFRDQSGECNQNVSACLLTDNPGLVNLSEPGFFDDQAYVPSQWLAADGNYMIANADEIRRLYGLQQGGSEFLPADAFSIDETNATVYLQADYGVDIGSQRLDGQIGVRVIQLDTDMDFMEVDDEGNWNPINSEASETTVLPNIVIRYSFTDDLMARFTYGETIRRPGYGDLNPATTYQKSSTGLEYGTASSGNPALKPAESINYDLSLEWYFAESSSLYGVLFRRDVTGFIVGSVTNITVADPEEPDGTYDYRLSQPANSADGKLEGIELGLVYFPQNVPAWLDGFGVQASYTWLDGENYDPVFEDGVLVDKVTNPLIGVSDTSYSVVLAYDKQDFDLRLSYVYRDEFLTGYNTCCSMPSGTYSKPEASMDFQLSYDVTDNIVVTFDATNLTGEIYQGYYTDDHLYNNGASLFSRTFALGLRYSM